MKPVAKLIHKTYASYLPTGFPAHYYGMPNGKIFLVFSQFYEADFGKTGLEFIFAEHKDFTFDYDNELLISKRKKMRGLPVFAEHLDYPRAKYNILHVKRGLRSYAEAQHLLNQQATHMLQSSESPFY
jgi:hypothetical protein